MHTLILDADGRAHRLFWYAGTGTRAAIIGSAASPEHYTEITLSQDELAALRERGDIFEATLEESARHQAATAAALARPGAKAPCFATTEAIEAARALHVELGRAGIRDHYRFASEALRRPATRPVEHLRSLSIAEGNDVRLALAVRAGAAQPSRRHPRRHQKGQRLRPTRGTAPY